MITSAQVGRAARLLLSLAFCAAISGCQEGPLAPRGSVARVEHELLFEALGAMLLVVVPVLALALGVAYWFRAGNPRARYLPKWEYSGKIEFSIWVIPMLVVVFLGTLAWVGAHMHDPYKPLVSDKQTLRVQVVSLDWKWIFIYPDHHVATINHLVLPVGRPVHLDLTSGTVMNSFFVPQLAGQVYTMAGMKTQLSLMADAQGSYHGFSAQFSGDGFSDMRFDAKVVSDDEFKGWLAEAAKSQATLDAPAYHALAMTHAVESTKTFGNVTPDLFQTALSESASTMSMGSVEVTPRAPSERNNVR
jgi:cytochrome o ubiquinol oxidase subunit II